MSVRKMGSEHIFSSNQRKIALTPIVIVVSLTCVAGGCSKKPPQATQTTPPTSTQPSPAVGGQPPTATVPVAATPPTQERLAGYLFGVPVPIGNYYFASRVSHMFPRPWEEGLAGEAREQAIWDALILHYESFRRGITVSDEEMERGINKVLKSQQQAFTPPYDRAGFTRAGDPEAYGRWVKETLNEPVELFENQMRYLFQVDKLKDEIRRSMPVTVTEQEMQQEFLNESHHVGGEMVTFPTKEEAQAFYERVRDPAGWEAMKAEGTHEIKPVSLMTLEAYIDLWAVPREQMEALHALGVGSVGPPMPFGTTTWCVYHLLEKRTGDLAEFPARREAYDEQLKTRKQYEGLNRWIEELKTSANLQVLLRPEDRPIITPAPTPESSSVPAATAPSDAPPQEPGA